MNTAITIAGIVFLVLVAFAAFMSAGAWLIQAWKDRHDRLYSRLYDKAVRDLGSRIHSSAYWFSEDPSAYALARVMGQKMMEWPAYDASGVRDGWREEAAKERLALAERTVRIMGTGEAPAKEGGDRG